MGFLRSLTKQWKLQQLSKVLGEEHGLESLVDDFRSGRTSGYETALEQLLDLCESDSTLRTVLQQHQVTRDELRKVYADLEFVGAGQWAGKHFVPVSTLGYATTLDFVLARRNRRDWERTAVLLLEYFERGDTGPVPSELRGPVA